MPLTPEQQQQLLAAFLHCTRDHNTGFNPAWEYFGKSEMQKLWYEFEYFHGRFLKKAAVEIGDRAMRVLVASGVGAAMGAGGGPVGAGVGAATSAIGLAIPLGFMAIASNATTKGKRQWGLHKGRGGAQTGGNGNQPGFQTLRPTDAARYYFYFWPGYQNSRLSLQEYFHAFQANGQPLLNSTFGQLKQLLFFKPPKSGERLNLFEFLYPLEVLDNSPGTVLSQESLKRFTLIWQASSCWPMLDYLYFNQSFYTTFQKWEQQRAGLFTPEKLKNFFYAARYYFLSRDFYLDHFFENILPKYDLILTRYGGVVVGSEMIDNAFLRLGQYINQGSDHLIKYSRSQKVAQKLLSVSLPFCEDFSPEMTVNFQKTIRALFFIVLVSNKKPAPHTQIVQDELASNEQEYNNIIENADLSPVKKKIALRKLFLKRRAILDLETISQSQLFEQDNIQKVSQEALYLHAQEAGHSEKPPLLNIHPLGDLLESQLIRRELQETEFSLENLAEWLEASALSGGIKVGLGLIYGLGSALGDSTLLKDKLDQLSEPHLTNIHHLSSLLSGTRKFYSGMRLCAGTADFISKISSDTKLSELLIGEGTVGASVGSVFLLGPTVLNFMVGVAIQSGKNHFYSKLDFGCLTIVDSLIEAVPNPPLPSQAPATSPLRVSVPPAPPQDVSRSLKRNLSTKFFEYLNEDAGKYLAEAEIFGSSVKKMAKSKLKLAGMLTKGKYSVVNFNFSSLPEGKVLEVKFDGRCVECNSNKLQFGNLDAACSIQGTHIVHYAQTMAGMYSVLLAEWVVSLQRVNAASASEGEILTQYNEFCRKHMEDLNKKNGKYSGQIPSLYYNIFNPRSPNANDWPKPEGLATLTILWSAATEIAFELLNLEYSIVNYSKAKKISDQYIKMQKVFDVMIHFIQLVKEQSKSYGSTLQDLRLNPDLLPRALPKYLGSQLIFIRLLYLSGMSLFTQWIQAAFQNLERSARSSRVREEQWRPVLNTIPLFIETLRTERASASSSASASASSSASEQFTDIFEFIQKDRLSQELQKNEYRYHTNTLELLVRRIKVVKENFIQVNIKLNPIIDSNSAASRFHNYSELGLGFRFKKDPTQFNAAEKTLLYSHFGRIVRHLFMNAPDPEKLLHLKTKAESHLSGQAVGNNSADTERWIEAFFSDYFQYIEAVCKMSHFVYYSRVYQFLQQSLKTQFLIQSHELRNSTGFNLRQNLETLRGFAGADIHTAAAAASRASGASASSSAAAASGSIVADQNQLLELLFKELEVETEQAREIASAFERWSIHSDRDFSRSRAGSRAMPSAPFSPPVSGESTSSSAAAMRAEMLAQERAALGRGRSDADPYQSLATAREKFSQSHSAGAASGAFASSHPTHAFCSRCHARRDVVYVGPDLGGPMYQCTVCGKQVLIGG